MKRIVVGITGATGVIYGVRLLEKLREAGAETHLVLSDWAKTNLSVETDYLPTQVEALAHQSYDNGNLGASIASGSFPTDGMVVLPCSMKTLSAVAHGYADTLIVRAADVAIKEGRPLILCPRETPLSAIHLENMLLLSRLGVKIAPPMPGFYNRPQGLEDIVGHHCMKILDLLGLESGNTKRWQGLPETLGV